MIIRQSRFQGKGLHIIKGCFQMKMSKLDDVKNLSLYTDYENLKYTK